MVKRDSHLPQKSTDTNLIGMDGELNRPLSIPKTDDVAHSYADKKQDRFRPDSPELHFTTSLYIDRAIELLREHAHQAHHQQEVLDIKCDIVSVDDDRAHFKLESLHMGKITGRLEGTMQRWQGNLTRVDVNTRHIQEIEPPSTGQAITGIVLSLVFIMLILVVISEISQGTFPDVDAILHIFVILVLLVFFITTYFYRTKEIETSVPTKRSRSDVNELINILVSAYGEHDLQWINK